MTAASNLSISMEDAESEWLKIVSQGTAKATKFLIEKTDCGSSKLNPLTVAKHAKIVQESFKIALRIVSGTVHERETIRDSWTIQPGLDFGSDDSSWIYVRHDHPTSDIYKIGRTTRKEKRNSAYATHSAESKEIASYPETEHLTEKKIHNHFSSKRVKLEFFRLNQDDVETVICPKKMRKAITEKQAK